MKSKRYPVAPPKDPNNPSRLDRTRNVLHLHRKKKDEGEELGANGGADDGLDSNETTIVDGAARRRRVNGNGDMEETGEVNQEEDDEDVEEQPQLTYKVAMGLLVVVTVVCAPTRWRVIDSDVSTRLAARRHHRRVPRQLHRWSHRLWQHFRRMGRSDPAPHRR